MTDGTQILLAGLLLLACLFLHVVAKRLRVPSLVLFLVLGMVVGSDGLGWIYFDNYELAQFIGVIALSVILFEGGLSTRVSDLRSVFWVSLRLATFGTLITAAVVGFVASLIFHFSIAEGFLIGAIVASTDGAATFSLLRFSPLKSRLAATLEAESGLNDPIAVLLVIITTQWLGKTGFTVWQTIELCVTEVVFGGAIGLLVGLLAVVGLSAFAVETKSLLPVASIAVIAIAYGLADTVGGSGFLAVYIAGITIATKPLPGHIKETIQTFQQGIAWVAQISLFLVLGLLVFPSQLPHVAKEGMLLACVLVFLARPLAVLASTVFSKVSRNEKLVLSWAGLRGAVPVVLATFPVLADIPHSIEFFNIVFFAVFVSTVLQGSTFEFVARKLGALEAGKK